MTEEECCICLVELCADERIHKCDTCSKSIHYDCLVKQVGTKCPLCKSELSGISPNGSGVDPAARIREAEFDDGMTPRFDDYRGNPVISDVVFNDNPTGGSEVPTTASYRRALEHLYSQRIVTETLPIEDVQNIRRSEFARMIDNNNILTIEGLQRMMSNGAIDDSDSDSEESDYDYPDEESSIPAVFVFI